MFQVESERHFEVCVLTCIGNMDLSIIGKSCKISHENTLAMYYDEGKSLILWRDETKLQLWVDKYDVRLLLDDLKELDVPSHPHILMKDENENDMDEERFADLHSGIMLTAENPASKRDAGGGEGGAAVLWDYTDSSTGKPFVKPEWLHIPAEVAVLPKTQMQFNVILHTVKRLTAGGSATGAKQLEVLLRLKMSAENSKMAFLNADDELHPFYLHIRSLEEGELWSLLLNKPPGSPSLITAPVSTASAIGSDALSALVGGYCSDESSTEEDKSDPPTNATLSATGTDITESLGDDMSPYDCSVAEIMRGDCVDEDCMMQWDCDRGIKLYAPSSDNARGNGAATGSVHSQLSEGLGATSAEGAALTDADAVQREQRLHKARLIKGRLLMLSEEERAAPDINPTTHQLEGRVEDSGNNKRIRSCSPEIHAQKRNRFIADSSMIPEPAAGTSFSAKVTLALRGLYAGSIK